MITRGLAENFISSKINIINKITGWLFIIVFCCYLD
jgi:BASS family bile acid:Na+ symporter